MPIIVEPTTDPQSTVALTEVFLNDPPDPTDSAALAYVGDSLRVTRAVGGGVDHDSAPGRSRAWSPHPADTTGPLPPPPPPPPHTTRLHPTRRPTWSFPPP